jgi:hypothetical protein
VCVRPRVTTESPDPVERPGPGEPEEAARPEPTRRRRTRRRAERAGTNPTADDAPDVVPPRAEPAPGETQHDRWLREQRPPHWE